MSAIDPLVLVEYRAEPAFRCEDAAVMLLGVILLTAVWGNTLQGWVIGYAWSLFIYGELSRGTGWSRDLTLERRIDRKSVV